MSKVDILRQLHAYKKNPDKFKELSPTQLVELIIPVLNSVATIDQMLKEGRLDGKTPQPDKEYLSLSSAKKGIQEALNRFVSEADAELGKRADALEKTVLDRLEALKNGEDGVVTEAEIERAAQLAHDLIELPDFDALITARFTANPEAIRDSLELLQGDDRLDISAIKGVDELANDINQRIGIVAAGGVSRNTVQKMIDESGGGTGTVETIVAGTGITVDSTDPANPIVSATGGGGSGDMEASVYDPQGIQDDAFDRANHTGTQTASTISDFDAEVSNNSDVAANTSARHTRSHTMTSTSDHTAGNHKVFYSNGSGQVTELALGADGTYLKSNGTTSAPSFATPPGGGGGTMDDFLVAADTGTPETVGDGETLTIAGGTGIDTSVSATDTVTVALDSATQTSLGLADSAVQPGDLATVATSGDYGDLSNTPSIPDSLDDLSGSLDDIAAGTTNKHFTATDESKLDGIEANADVTDAGNVGAVNAAATSKGTPVNADSFPIVDSEASNVIKRLTFTNLKAFLKTYFDGLYAAALGSDDNYVTDAEKTKLSNISITQAVDLDAIESASHAAVTVSDSSEIDFTLTGQQISASIVSASIDESKLDASVNASLDLADSALQPSDIASGTITARADDINFSGGSDGHVLTVQADGSLALEAPAGGTVEGDSITDLNAMTTPVGTDVMVIVDDPGGTPETQKITMDNLEAYFESALDTLPNVTSIQGRTVTLADAGADAILGWDDSANAYENLTQAEVLAVIGDAAADGSTKGVAAFNANDFNASSGVITIDYTNAQKASDTQAGLLTELATIAETNTGTDAVRAVTPDGLAGSYAGTKSVSIQVTAGDGDVSTGDGQAYITIPEALNGMNLIRANATVVTAGTTNATTVMVHNKTDAADMLSGAISIASAGTVGTAGTVNTSTDDVATNDVLRIDVDSVSTTKPKGLVVVLEFRLP